MPTRSSAFLRAIRRRDQETLAWLVAGSKEQDFSPRYAARRLVLIRTISPTLAPSDSLRVIRDVIPSAKFNPIRLARAGASARYLR